MFLFFIAFAEIINKFFILIWYWTLYDVLNLILFNKPCDETNQMNLHYYVVYSINFLAFW